jgi:hypothetical protein
MGHGAWGMEQLSYSSNHHFIGKNRAKGLKPIGQDATG